jgi:mRNA interferase YafQ
MGIVNLLVADMPLPYRNFDHPLSGEWVNHRDCQIKPDLILIYRKTDPDHLDLVRIGSPRAMFIIGTCLAWGSL